MLYAYIWKYHNETPLQLISANKKVQVYLLIGGKRTQLIIPGIINSNLPAVERSRGGWNDGGLRGGDPLPVKFSKTMEK
jgi:hypothetical protein